MSSSDAQATHAYLLAQYRLAAVQLRESAAARVAEGAAVARITRECRGVVSGMPKEPSLTSFPLPPRVRGENARLSQQKQAIEAELDAAVLSGNGYRPALEAYAAEMGRLAWSNPAITAAAQAATRGRLEADPGPVVPSFCADARAWAQSGYRVLTRASREFEAAQAERHSSVQSELYLHAELSLITLLKPYENLPDRSLIRRTSEIERRLTSGFESIFRKVLSLARIVGFPAVGLEEPKQVTVGHGRTAAGTSFEVSSTSGSGLLGAGSCHRAATVAYSRPGALELLVVSGPNNPICLSPPRYRHPALFCEVGRETIQTAVPASVRSARLVLVDGRTIESRVVRMPRRGGGHAGIYAQQILGSRSHAVSLVELDAGGNIVLTLKLPRYRCVKPRIEQPVLPTTTTLASGLTPGQEAFTIGAFGRFNNEPFVSVDIGVDPELDEPAYGLGESKAFPWKLSIGCSPHTYAIVYGILAPPGKSVVARTPQGLVPLNVVPVEPSVRAKGPIVYGVFSALPSELAVLSGNGSTVYTESLQEKATEAAQFCVGYAEP